MSDDSNKLPPISPVELARIAPLDEASRLSSLSEDSLLRHHADKLVRPSPRRIGMRVGDALMLGAKNKSSTEKRDRFLWGPFNGPCLTGFAARQPGEGQPFRGRLEYHQMLHIPINDRRRKKVSGRFLAHNRLKPGARRRLANDIRDGRIEITDLTWKQLALLCRVSVPTIRKAADTVTSETLAQHFRRSSREEWRECGRTLGPAVVWDEMIAPLV
jgi:hypothetical protein